MVVPLERNALADALASELDIPDSHYEKACDRYASIGRWLHREDSLVVALAPQVSAQGSFQYGTVIPPLDRDGEYDLDLVCLLQTTKDAITQARLKEVVGAEIQSYAERYGMLRAPDEGKRCWTLHYADGVSFHIDILPCVPEDLETISHLVRAGAPAGLARHAVAITDRNHPCYHTITRDWARSNPVGLREWFKLRAEPHRLGRVGSSLREEKDIADVPSYRWKTPLQRAIQVMKRHRDVTFRKDPDLAPISMIITALAGQAYRGETTVLDALIRIVGDMPAFIRRDRSRVPNPVNPLEDFADRWRTDERLERAFWSWYEQLQADVEALQSGDEATLPRRLREAFSVDLPGSARRAVVTLPARTIHISRPAKPWGTA